MSNNESYPAPRYEVRALSASENLSTNKPLWLVVQISTNTPIAAFDSESNAFMHIGRLLRAGELIARHGRS